MALPDLPSLAKRADGVGHRAWRCCGGGGRSGQRQPGVRFKHGLHQLWGLVLLETGLIAGVAGLLSMPTGYILALISVYIINRRSFGWTLQMQVDPKPYVEALLVAILAALLAGLYPAWRMGRMIISEVMRSEYCISEGGRSVR